MKLNFSFLNWLKKYKMPKNIQYFIFSFVFFIACKSDKIVIKNPTVFFQELIADDKNAIFKNINFDFSKDDVIDAEKSQQYDATESYLAYSYNFPKDTSKFVEYADIKYFFDEHDVLKIITVNVYLNDSIQETQLLDNFKEYYSHKYDAPKIDEYQYYSWDATADSKITKGKYYYNIGIKKLAGEYGLALEFLRL